LISCAAATDSINSASDFDDFPATIHLYAL
jgi:hypothetical protein